MKFFSIFIILTVCSLKSFASTPLAKFEVTLGQKNSTFEFYTDQTYKTKSNNLLKKTGKLNNKNYQYFKEHFSARKSLSSYPTKGCLREKMTLEMSGQKIQSCIKAKNKTARSLTELSNRLRFLM